MIDALYIATAAGLSLGLVAGYRAGKAVVRRVGGPFARTWLVIGLAVAGSCGLLAPASIFAIFGTRNLGGPGGGLAGSGSPAVMLGIAIGIAVVIASALVVGAFTGALCARIIEELRPRR